MGSCRGSDGRAPPHAQLPPILLPLKFSGRHNKHKILCVRDRHTALANSTCGYSVLCILFELMDKCKMRHVKLTRQMNGIIKALDILY